MNCPDCGAVVDRGRTTLAPGEFVETIQCPDCPFGIETMSNLAWRDRHQ